MTNWLFASISSVAIWRSPVREECVKTLAFVSSMVLPLIAMVLPLIAVSASAAEALGDAQMDQITAGGLPSCGGASMCTVNLASSATLTNTVDIDGVIVTTTIGTGSCTAAACMVQGTGTMPTTSGSTTVTGNGVTATGS